jgi:phosphoenolpyruvate synthase/pyruvate phosphate dikinase
MEEESFKRSFVRWFSNLDRKFVQSVGYKGANLGELRSLHLNVPNGFVITTHSFDFFLEKNNLKEKIKNLLENVDSSKSYELEKVSKMISEMILKADFPQEIKEEIVDSYESLGSDSVELERGSALEILSSASEPVFVAIRNSLPWEKDQICPREQESYFNIKGISNVLLYVKKVFASLFNPKTLYRLKKREIREQDFKIAVVIQEMVDSDRSGIIISEDVGGNILVKSIWGFGEGMNLGEIVPDEYLLSKNWEILERKVSEKKFEVRRDSSGVLRKFELRDEKSNYQVLSDYEIQRLANVASRIQEHFMEPQEIEFAFSQGELFILQASRLKKRNLEVKEEKISVEEIPSKEVKRISRVTKTKLKAILNSPSFAESAREAGLGEVSFIKLENLIKRSGKHPKYFLDNYYINEYENIIYNSISTISNFFDSFWVRTSDFFEKEFENLEGAPQDKEENPCLGLHGIKFGLKHLDILKAELNALKRISLKGKDVGVLLPQVSSLKEIEEVRKILDEFDFHPKLGVVIETPASIQLVKDFCETGISYFVFDFDDLIQNLLCVDKNREDLKEFYEELHPAVLYQTEYALRVAKRKGVETTVFGNVLKNRELLKFLIDKEVGSISVEPFYAKSVSEEVYSIEEEVLKGTDREMRKYEEIKEKEKIKEISSVEKSVEDDSRIVEEGLNTDEKLEKDLEMIEEEKKEYLDKHPEEDERLDEDEEDLEDEDIDIPEEKNEDDPLGIF